MDPGRRGLDLQAQEQMCERSARVTGVEHRAAEPYVHRGVLWIQHENTIEEGPGRLGVAAAELELGQPQDGVGLAGKAFDHAGQDGSSLIGATLELEHDPEEVRPADLVAVEQNGIAVAGLGWGPQTMGVMQHTQPTIVGGELGPDYSTVERFLQLPPGVPELRSHALFEERGRGLRNRLELTGGIGCRGCRRGALGRGALAR